MKEDSIEGIYDTLKICAQISKSAGGIGLSIHNVRARNSYIRGTNGTSVSWRQTSLLCCFHMLWSFTPLFATGSLMLTLR
jgi:hypothetical protein